MSYEIYFVSRDPGQSWEEALEASQARQPAEGCPLRWDEVVTRVRKVLGEVSVFENPPVWEVTHTATGIQVTCFGGEWGLSVPYWSHSDEAIAITEKLYALAVIIEDETGLAGFDPQLERPTTEYDDQTTTAARNVFDQVAAHFGRLRI